MLRRKELLNKSSYPKTMDYLNHFKDYKDQKK